MEQKALYERFEQLLKEFNIRPYAVAQKAGVSQPTLSDWKLGKSEPKRATLEKICKAYGKDLSFFYGEEKKGGPKYYLNDETAAIAQDIFENRELRALFDVQRDMGPEDLKALHQMALALKRKERAEDENSTD